MAEGGRLPKHAARPLAADGRFLAGKGYYLVYTMGFCVIALVAFAPFVAAGKGLIWSSDGISQHYEALMYYGAWLRGIAKSLLQTGAISVPLWDFSIGYGSDVLTTLNYYVIGDPLTLFSIFARPKQTEALYYALDIARMYLAGFCFSLYCRKMGRSSEGALAASFVYVFGSWALMAGLRHPFFMNPLIYLPLITLGFEKVLRRESPIPFVLAIGVSAASNFYFFYMLVITLLVYAVLRYFAYYGKGERSMRSFAGLAGRSLAYGTVGVLLACPLLVPTICAFLNASRSSFETVLPAFYNLLHYQDLAPALITTIYGQNYAIVGMSAPALLGVFALFAQKGRYGALKLAVVLATLVLFVPAAGAALNGFSYAANRWAFAYLFLLAFVFATVWPHVTMLSRRTMSWIVGGVALYGVALALASRTSAPVVSSFAVLVIALAFALAFCRDGSSLARRAGRVPQAVMMALIALGIGVNCYWCYSPAGFNYAADFVDAGTAYAKVAKTASFRVGKLQSADAEFNRIDQQTYQIKNTSINAPAHTTQYFWSLANGGISDFMTEVGLSHRRMSDNYYRLEGRAMLESLASVKYFVSRADYSPYGFEFDDSISTKKMRVFESGYGLPLGFVDNEVMPVDEWRKLSLAQKQEALFQSIVVDADDVALPDGTEDADVAYAHAAVDFKVELGDGVVRLGDRSLLAGKAGATVTLRFDGLPNCETYVQVEGLSLQPYSLFDLYLDDDQTMYPSAEYDALSVQEKNSLAFAASDFGNYRTGLYDLVFEAGDRTQRLRYMDASYKHATGQTDFLVNMGYSEKPLAEATIALPEAGVYSVEDLQVVMQPFDGFTERVAACRARAMREESIGVNEVSGVVDDDRGGLLRLSIPYDRGWSAVVDGVSTPVMRADGMFMAIPVDAGRHDVELRYETYGLRAGVALFGAGIVCLACLVIISIRTRRTGRG